MRQFTTRNSIIHRRRLGFIAFGVSMIAVSAAIAAFATQGTGPGTTDRTNMDAVERLVRDPAALTESLLGETKPWERSRRIERIRNHVLGFEAPALDRAERLLALGKESFGGVLWGLRDAAQIIEDLAAEEPAMANSSDLRSAVIDLQRHGLHILMHSPEREAWVAFLAPDAMEDVNLFWAAVQNASVGIEDESFRTTQLVGAWRVTIAGYFSALGEHALAAEAHESALEQLFALDEDALVDYLAGIGAHPEWLLSDKAVELVRAGQAAAAIETLDRITALPASLRSGPMDPSLAAPTVHSHAVTVAVIISAWQTSDFAIDWLDRIDWKNEDDKYTLVLFVYVMLGGGRPDETQAERLERLAWIVRHGEFLLNERPDLLHAGDSMRVPGEPEPTQQYELELATANMMYGLFQAYQQLGHRDKALAIGEQFLERYSDYEGAAPSVANGVFRMRREIP